MASASSPTAPRSRRVNWDNLAFSLGLPLLALAFALAVCAVILLLLGVNPLEAYAAMISGAFGTVSGITQSIAKATPLLLVGLGICIAFRASVINIGAEGQIILGALGATWFSLAFRPILPDALLVIGTLLAGFLAGAFWGFIPGILKARFSVNRFVSTALRYAAGEKPWGYNRPLSPKLTAVSARLIPSIRPSNSLPSAKSSL